MLIKIISVGWAYLLLCSYKNIIQYYTDHTEIKATVNIKKLMMWFCAVLVWLVKENVTTTKVSPLNVWFLTRYALLSIYLMKSSLLRLRSMI